MKSDQPTKASPVSVTEATEVPAGQSKKAPKIPPPLARFVLKMESRLERTLRRQGFSESLFDVMEDYRSAVVHGLTNPEFVKKYRACWMEIQGVCDARQLLQEYNPAAYRTRGAISDIQSANAKKSRPKSRAEKLDEIGRWLANQKYRESDDKAALIERAKLIFKCGDTDVRDAARGAGLTRRYAKNTK